MLYMPRRVRRKPVTRQNSAPSFQPSCREAMKSTGTPNTDMISSEKVMFINSKLNSVFS